MATAAVPWREAALAWRDRLLASAGFRRWAAAFVPTRWIARRRATALFDLAAGFVYSQVLLACVRVRLFELLAQQGPQTLAGLAASLRLPLAGTERLVLAAVSLRLLEPRPQRGDGPRYGLGPLGAPMVGNLGLAAMVEHHAVLYRDLVDPVALLRGGAFSPQLAGFWAYAGSQAPGALPQADLAAYSRLMAASQPLVAEQVLQAYPLRRHHRLLDVGGGDGAFACAAARHAPALQVQVFDLPGVVAGAAGRFEQAGLSARCTVAAGDFLRDPLPTGADLVCLLRVVHDHNDPEVLVLLRAVHRALVAGGRLLLAEPMAETPGAEAMGHAYFGFYLLAMGQGQPRNEARLRTLLQAAGFSRVRRLQTHLPLQTGVLLADRD